MQFNTFSSSLISYSHPIFLALSIPKNHLSVTPIHPYTSIYAVHLISYVSSQMSSVRPPNVRCILPLFQLSVPPINTSLSPIISAVRPP